MVFHFVPSYQVDDSVVACCPDDEQKIGSVLSMYFATIVAQLAYSNPRKVPRKGTFDLLLILPMIPTFPTWVRWGVMR